MSQRKVFLIISLVLFASTMLFGQTESPGNAKHEYSVIAIVTDRSDRFVSGVTKAEFSVEAFGKKQKILEVSSFYDPVSVGILVDTSGSMRRRGLEVVHGVGRFLERTGDSNDYLVMEFGEQSLVIQEFTIDRQAVLNSVIDSYSTVTKGDTSLYDAITEGVQKLQSGAHKDKVLLLVTDGMNNRKGRFEELKNEFKRNQIKFFTVNVADRTGFDSLQFLKVQSRLFKLAEITGGAAYYPVTSETILESFARIGEESKTGYRVRFEVAKEAVDRAVRKDSILDIEVKILSSKGKKSKRLSVRARQNLFVNNESLVLESN